MTSYTFTIPGRPVPKGRPRLGVRGKKAFVYTPPATVEYEKFVGWVAKASGCKPLNGPLSVKLQLFIRGHSGDVDNYCKSILDGLNGVAYEDDDQVVELLVRKHKVKRKEEERVEIEIREASA
jgi:crossover junction endodeoxyribonuclease RusA